MLSVKELMSEWTGVIDCMMESVAVIESESEQMRFIKYESVSQESWVNLWVSACVGEWVSEWVSEGLMYQWAWVSNTHLFIVKKAWLNISESVSFGVGSECRWYSERVIVIVSFGEVISEECVPKCLSERKSECMS